jgi:hypothetical protein
VPNYWDFLVALDDHLIDSSLGYVAQPNELHAIAERAGLVPAGATYRPAANWTGWLLDKGLIEMGPLGGGDRQPIPPGHLWTEHDLGRFRDFSVTTAGREEAERIRRQRRSQLTDAAMGVAIPEFVRPWMTDGQRRAVVEPLASLRVALDNERWPAAIGAAKDLAEAACKVCIEHTGETVPGRDSLPSLFKLARAAAGSDAAEADLGNRLASVVDHLAQRRNVAGRGRDRLAGECVHRRGRMASVDERRLSPG